MLLTTTKEYNWQIINMSVMPFCGYMIDFAKLPHTTCTYYIHTTYRMSNHIVFFWTSSGETKRFAWNRKSSFTTPFGMRKGFVTFQTISLAIIWLKLLRILLLNMISPFVIGGINYLMNGIYLDWFQNPKNIHHNVFDKIPASLVGEKKSPKHFYSILRNHPYIDS